MNRGIVLLGDFCVNINYFGKMSSIAFDAPVPIVNVHECKKTSGNTGIIAGFLNKFNVEVFPITMIGNDSNGNIILEDFKKMGLSRNTIIMDDTPTASITRVISNSVQLSRFDMIPNIVLNPRKLKKLDEIFMEYVKKSGIVMIADYGFGLINPASLKRIIEYCSSHNIPILASSVNHNYYMFKDTDVMIKINMRDASSIIKQDIGQKTSSEHICKQLVSVLGINKILLTRAEQGIAVYENERVVEYPATKDKKFEVKGIGEVMSAVIGMNLVKNKSFSESCKLGNIAAGLAVSLEDIKLITKNRFYKVVREYEEWFNQK